LGRPIAFAQTPLEQVRHYSKETALMLEWFDRVGFSADIPGLEREFGRALTKLPDWARRYANKLDTETKNPKESSHESCQTVGIRWAIGVEQCTDADDRTRRDLGEDQEYCRQSSGSC
jgi:hypothetical protein